MNTKHLPENNTDENELRERYLGNGRRWWFEYVSREELDALHKARDKLAHPEREDLTSEDVMKMFAPQLQARWQPEEDES